MCLVMSESLGEGAVPTPEDQQSKTRNPVKDEQILPALHITWGKVGEVDSVVARGVPPACQPACEAESSVGLRRKASRDLRVSKDN